MSLANFASPYLRANQDYGIYQMGIASLIDDGAGNSTCTINVPFISYSYITLINVLPSEVNPPIIGPVPSLGAYSIGMYNPGAANAYLKFDGVGGDIGKDICYLVARWQL